jgi:hypothetical protein
MLNFSEWDRQYYSVDESEEGIVNWLSRTFGGKIKKIDSILADLTYLEKEYATQWEKDQSLIYDLKGQIDTGELSDVEEKDFRKKIGEAKDRVADSSRKKIQQIRSYNEQAMKTVDKNSRVHKYWDLKKSESEVEVMKNLYEISKKFPDKNLEDKLYGEYKKSYEDLKKKEKGFDSISKDVDREEEIGKDSIEGLSLSSLIKMSIPSFRSEIKNYSSSQLKSLKKSLIDRKNLALNELRTLRRSKNKDLDRVRSKEDKTLTLNKYNSRIYEVGEVIDKIREKISHLNA